MKKTEKPKSKREREDNMDEKVCISSIWPPTTERRHVLIFAHRDGRKVQYEHGPCEENDASRALLAKRGDICGTIGSCYIWEAFPDEPVCTGCVAISAVAYVCECGSTRFKSSTTHPKFDNGVRSAYCPKCRDREASKVRQQYERDMRILGVAPYANAGKGEG